MLPLNNVALLLIGWSCGGQSSDPQPPVADQAAEAAPVTTAVPNQHSLPDLSQGLDKTFCEEGPGGPGATRYFLGTLSVLDSSVEGTETWILYANSEWKEKGGVDCTAVWSLVGRPHVPSKCSDCDLAIVVRATLSESDCPEDLIKDEEAFRVSYDIRRSEDGTSHWYFSSTGTDLGQGYHKDSHVNYVTDPSCMWF